MKHSISKKIRCFPQEKLDLFEERMGVLKKALKIFDGKVAKLPTRDRQAARFLLCEEFLDRIFVYQAAVDKIIADDLLQTARTVNETVAVHNDFYASLEDLIRLHVGI
jgi:hypothetical protein